MDNNYRKTLEYRICYMYSNIKKRSKLKNYTDVCSKEEFYSFAKNNKTLIELHNVWISMDCELKYVPTVDRINNENGYSIDNIQFLTKSENSSKGNKETKTGVKHSRKTSDKMVRAFNENEDLIFDNGRSACDYFNVNRCYVSLCISRGYKLKGYSLEYVQN